MSNYQLFQNDLPLQSLKSFKGDITIDTETLGLNIKRDRLCLIQLRNESNKKVYLIKFDKDMKDPALEARINKETNQMRQSGIPRLSVPKFLINGKEPQGGRNTENFSAIIEAELKKK